MFIKFLLITILCSGSSYGIFGQSLASITADRMNVFYIGVDNPISVYMSSVSGDKMEVTGSEGITVKKTVQACIPSMLLPPDWQLSLCQ